MKKIFLLLWLLIGIASLSDAQTINVIVGQPLVTGATPLCSETFTTGDTGSVAANSSFELEDDTYNKLDIYSNYLRFSADTAGGTGAGWVTDTSGCVSGETEITIKFKFMLTDITSIHSGGASLQFCRFNDSDTTVAVFYCNTAASGDFTGYRAYRGNLAEAGNAVTGGGLAADTWYDGYIYYVESATTGGVELKIGSLAVSNTGFNDDNSADDGLTGGIILGARVNDWGSGATDTFVCFDDWEVYSGDQR